MTATYIVPVVYLLCQGRWSVGDQHWLYMECETQVEIEAHTMNIYRGLKGSAPGKVSHRNSESIL